MIFHSNFRCMSRWNIFYLLLSRCVNHKQLTPLDFLGIVGLGLKGRSGPVSRKFESSRVLRMSAG